MDARDERQRAEKLRQAYLAWDGADSRREARADRLLAHLELLATIDDRRKTPEGRAAFAADCLGIGVASLGSASGKKLVTRLEAGLRRIAEGPGFR